MFPGKRANSPQRKTLAALFLIISIFSASFCSAVTSNKNFGGLVENGAVMLEHSGQLLVTINPDSSLIPASTLKIATSLLALDILGNDFRFTTNLYIHENSLYIQGKGDPYLVSEEIERMAGMLRAQGIKAVDHIVLDDGYFDLTKEDFYDNSNNPYDALNDALAVNFNTINIKVSKNGKVLSAEKQTPTLPLMRDFAVDLPPGTQRISLPRKQSVVLRYCGELFLAIFNKAGIRIKGGWQHGEVPRNAVLVLAYQSSKSVQDLLQGMLLYSNNFTANQLFLTSAARKYGAPATWEKARRIAREHFAGLGFSDKDLYLYEGSGLSRKNRVTAGTMLRLLHLFAPYRTLLPEKDSVMVKSGTLNGVYCYAGYLPSGQKTLCPFVILLNQPQNERDQVLLRLKAIPFPASASSHLVP
ncbi:MAG: D-alanyl-D-alanine carboxypeptidase [Deltaproteobacteria bacterium]